MRTGGITMPELEGDLAAQRLDPVEQVAAALGLDQVDEVERRARARAAPPADVGGQRLGGSGEPVPPVPARPRSRRRRESGQAGAEHTDERRPTMRNGSFGQAGDDGQASHDDAGDLHDAPVTRELAEHVVPEVVLGGGPGDDEAGRDRHQQRRDLGDQPVTDRQQAVGVDGLAERQVVAGGRRRPGRRSG